MISVQQLLFIALHTLLSSPKVSEPPLVRYVNFIPLPLIHFSKAPFQAISYLLAFILCPVYKQYCVFDD